jgi:hypothetical protein
VCLGVILLLPIGESRKLHDYIYIYIYIQEENKCSKLINEVLVGSQQVV